MTDDVWFKKSVSVSYNDRNFTFPNTNSPSYTIMPYVSTTPIDHYISQQFMNKINKPYMFSTYIKDVESEMYHKCAIIVKDLRYNVLLSAEFDMSKNYEYEEIDSNTYKVDLEIKFLNGTTYDSAAGVNKFFVDCSAKLIKIVKDNKVYYRPCIKFTSKNNTIVAVGIIFLDTDGSYSYTIPISSPSFYMSGAQIENINPNEDVPSAYISTTKKMTKSIIQQSLYKVDGSADPKTAVLMEGNKVWYINDGKELIVKTVITPGSYSTVNCICTGARGVVIPDTTSGNPATIMSENGDLFECVPGGRIPSSGRILLPFKSVEMGDIPVAQNTINKIVYKIQGWYTVNNPEDGIEGQPEVSTLETKFIDIKPTIYHPKDRDIAVIQSVISFGTVASDNKKLSVPNWAPRTRYTVKDKVKFLSNLYECIHTHTSSSSERSTVENFKKDIANWKLILDAVGLGFVEKDEAPYGSIYYNSKERVYKIKVNTEYGDKWAAFNCTSSEKVYTTIRNSLLYNQGIFETWNPQSCLFKPKYVLGYNTGGNYNFLKLCQIANRIPTNN